MNLHMNGTLAHHALRQTLLEIEIETMANDADARQNLVAEVIGIEGDEGIS